jgi:hypothetical protein
VHVNVTAGQTEVWLTARAGRSEQSSLDLGTNPIALLELGDPNSTTVCRSRSTALDDFSRPRVHGRHGAAERPTGLTATRLRRRPVANAFDGRRRVAGATSTVTVRCRWRAWTRRRATPTRFVLAGSTHSYQVQAKRRRLWPQQHRSVTTPIGGLLRRLRERPVELDEPRGGEPAEQRSGRAADERLRGLVGGRGVEQRHRRRGGSDVELARTNPHAKPGSGAEPVRESQPASVP